MRAVRLVDGPIISPASDPSIGTNIGGPSLVRVPDWVPNPLGRYYLYFADHKGDHIRMAHADHLAGPWTVFAGGVLSVGASHFRTTPPEAPEAEVERAVARMREFLGDYEPPEGVLTDLTTPHIASPDVRIDPAGRRFEMIFHGLEGLGVQLSRLAHSSDGLTFAARPEPIAGVYLRQFGHAGVEYALAMPGRLLRRLGDTDYEPGPDLLPVEARHSAVRVAGDRIDVFWTRVGDDPERIVVSEIDARHPWTEWRIGATREVLRPERAWEGADLPRRPSQRSAAPGPVHQLRDPAVYREDDRTFLVYAIAGESGLGIAELID